MSYFHNRRAPCHSNHTRDFFKSFESFFKRGNASLSDPATLWRTVTADLISGMSIVLQFLRKPQTFQMHNPLMKNQGNLSSAPPVVDPDALDECGSDKRIFLDTLTRWSHLPPLLKLITSHDEHLPFSEERSCRPHEKTSSTLRHLAMKLPSQIWV
jgi:hypothetical protein